MCRILIIADKWGITFHAVVVFGLGKDLLFKSVLGHCAENQKWKICSDDLTHTNLSCIYIMRRFYEQNSIF